MNRDPLPPNYSIYTDEERKAVYDSTPEHAIDNPYLYTRNEFTNLVKNICPLNQPNPVWSKFNLWHANWLIYHVAKVRDTIDQDTLYRAYICALYIIRKHSGLWVSGVRTPGEMNNLYIVWLTLRETFQDVKDCGFGNLPIK